MWTQCHFICGPPIKSSSIWLTGSAWDGKYLMHGWMDRLIDWLIEWWIDWWMDWQAFIQYFLGDFSWEILFHFRRSLFYLIWKRPIFQYKLSILCYLFFFLLKLRKFCRFCNTRSTVIRILCFPMNLFHVYQNRMWLVMVFRHSILSSNPKKKLWYNFQFSKSCFINLFHAI